MELVFQVTVPQLTGTFRQGRDQQHSPAQGDELGDPIFVVRAERAQPWYRLVLHNLTH